MELDAVGAGFVLVPGDGDCDMSGGCTVEEEGGDIDMDSGSLVAEIPAPARALGSQPVGDSSSNEDEFDDDLPPAEEITLPQP